MKTSKLLLVISLLFLIMGIGGCKKETSDINFMKQKIIGTWEWTVSYGGAVGIQNPQPKEKLEIIFTKNQVLITHNLEIIENHAVITDNKKVLQDGSYTINEKEKKSYITITPKNKVSDLLFFSGETEFIFNETFDMLSFSFSQGTAYFDHVFKKVN